jgi:hypothetical protein
MAGAKDGTVLDVLEERQGVILSRLPAFARITLPVAIIGFIATLMIHLITAQRMRERMIGFSWSEITLGSLIAGFLSLFSDLVIWIFVVWSLTFVPFIAYHAHKASRESQARGMTQPMRWVQLYASTFLPMAIFALAWNSVGASSHPPEPLKLRSLFDFLLLVASTALVFGLLAAINKWIPVRLAAVRLSLFSCLLYLSLFLSYGWGVGLASAAMVLGIVIYLMFYSADIAELGRRISIHDVDPKIAEQFERIAIGHQTLRTRQGENLLKQKEQEVQATEQQIDIGIEKSVNEMALDGQLKDIRKKKLSLNKKMNETQLMVLERKIDALGDVFTVISAEVTERMTQDVPEQIRELRENVKSYTREELQEKMNSIVSLLNRSLEGIPEGLAELRTQLLITTSEIEKQTRLIAAEQANDGPTSSLSSGDNYEASSYPHRDGISRP